MRTFETKSWRFSINDRTVSILAIPRPDGTEQAVVIDKVEFAEALCGLGIVHSAVVRHAEEKPAEVKA